jgi:ABC-type nickel/cobalt efflux system permease component RcnA
LHLRLIGYGWQKTLWKIVSNPAFEVIAAIVVVLFAAWIVIQTDTDQRSSHVPILNGQTR